LRRIKQQTAPPADLADFVTETLGLITEPQHASPPFGFGQPSLTAPNW
jgi:hypothetical protein